MKIHSIFNFTYTYWLMLLLLLLKKMLGWASANIWRPRACCAHCSMRRIPINQMCNGGNQTRALFASSGRKGSTNATLLPGSTTTTSATTTKDLHIRRCLLCCFLQWLHICGVEGESTISEQKYQYCFHALELKIFNFDKPSYEHLNTKATLTSWWPSWMKLQPSELAGARNIAGNGPWEYWESSRGVQKVDKQQEDVIFSQTCQQRWEIDILWESLIQKDRFVRRCRSPVWIKIDQ